MGSALLACCGTATSISPPNSATRRAIDLYLRYVEQRPSGYSTMYLYLINDATHRMGKGERRWSYCVSSLSQIIVGVDPNPTNNVRMIAWSKESWRALHP